MIGGRCYPPSAIARTLTLYVALSGEDRVARLTLDPDDGALRAAGSYALAGGPAPMAFDPGERLLYVSRRRDSRISTLTIEPDGSLTPAGELATPGGACYVSTDRTGRFLLSAYYADGAVAVHAIGGDGVAAGPPLCLLDTGAGAHILETDPTNRWAFSCTIAEPVGSNAVHQFLFDERTGTLRPNTPPRLIGENGCGPRHFCFHPRLPLVYVSNEQGGSVTAYRLDTGDGTLTRWHTVSTLPPGYQGENTCSQIRITPDGCGLFAPNRGHDSIANFALHPASGALSLREIVPTEPVPRACQLDPAGRLLLAAGQDSGRIAAYRIEPADGRLTPLAVSEVGESPLWILFRSDKEDARMTVGVDDSVEWTTIDTGWCPTGGPGHPRADRHRHRGGDRCERPRVRRRPGAQRRDPGVRARRHLRGDLGRGLSEAASLDLDRARPARLHHRHHPPHRGDLPAGRHRRADHRHPRPGRRARCAVQQADLGGAGAMGRFCTSRTGTARSGCTGSR